MNRVSTPIGVLIALAVMLGAGLVLRFATNTAALGPVWDEPVLQEVVAAIVDDGWTVSNALDYEDTKGPVFFWLYAGLGELIGVEVGDLRLITLAIFVLSGVPLGVLAAKCGMSYGQIAATAALYALLPYNAVLGQIFMSEPSFLLGSMVLLLIFVWGFGRDVASQHRVAGPLVFGLILALLLHHRIHVVAYAAAAVAVATRRDGVRSWPWWVACLGAGILRLPLYLRWGGLVSPEYQSRLGLGLRLESLTYLAISLLPCTVVLLWPLFAGRPLRRRRWWWVAAAAVAGLSLGLLAMPDLSVDAEGGAPRYLGMVARALMPLGSSAAQMVAVVALCTVGASALTAAAMVAAERPLDSPARIVDRLSVWTVLAGWLMYGLTRGVVFDRYMLPYVVLLPFLWVRRLPGWLLSIQGLGLLIMIIRLAMSHQLL